ncbi:MAG TPA: pantoate--beta-alanine ligase [Candidatus Nanopelagicaceae bacterium]|nr:pantoate--beta-alanine ligase [Candidatus Nanopelagicaceae bacterium]
MSEAGQEPGRPILLTAPDELRGVTQEWRCQGHRVGLVPTMGALHRGHMALVAAARAAADRVVVSIFVNPLQFGPGDDYQRYPRNQAEDLLALAAAGVDAAYLPPTEAVYPNGFATSITVDSASADRWEGHFRPGHFQGVAVVVAKLFAATGPCSAFFGEKDAQQAALVTRLARDIDLGVQVVVCPVVRDPDGLALSSRNAYLDGSQRGAALCLNRALRAAALAFREGSRSGRHLSCLASQVIESEPAAKLDYAAVVDPISFVPQVEADGSSRLILAARVGGVRLLDTGVLAELATWGASGQDRA